MKIILGKHLLKGHFQVEGREGVSLLAQKIRARGPFVLWHGSLAAASATAVGHFPWFFTFNTLNEAVPNFDDSKVRRKQDSWILEPGSNRFCFCFSS